MKAILRLLTNRMLWAVIGLILLAIVVWFGGPSISFGRFRPLNTDVMRMGAIFGIFGIYGLSQFRKVLRASKANKGMVEGLVKAEAAKPDRSAEEVTALKQKFEQAVEVLRKSKGKNKRLSLYDLPWYIIIGPPGSGKTTALVNSGLDFPLADHFGREALGGIGGTRNCDWWFTDEAILLDTAGRYTTQDSDAAADRSAWEGFLGLLKKYRSRRPINGVLVAISLQDLMVQNEGERIAHARAIKTRIQELDEFFKIRFPVYVMLTKADLVAGFNEFFDDLGRQEREQVWGFTFPFDVSESGGAVERFAPEFDALLEQLNRRVLLRMSQERDQRRRALVYGFPRQLASLRQNLQAFLGDVFRGSRFEQAPLLRGVYMTSGTQEGTPIDRLMGVVARTFGLDQQAYAAQGAQGRSYFIKSLLTEVVFNESEVAGTNRRLESRRAWLQRAAYAGCFAVVALMVVGWTFSYFNNRRLVDDAAAWAAETRGTIGEISGNPRNVDSVVRALDAVLALSDEVDERAGGFANVSHGLGLSQAGKLQRRAETVYGQLLDTALLPRLVQSLEDLMTDERATDDLQYETLKHYLMLDSQGHYDAESMINFFWNEELRGFLLGRSSFDNADAYRRHLEALFDSRPTIGRDYLDPELIDRMQQIVADIPIETRIYNRMKNDGRATRLAAFDVISAAGTEANAVFVRASGTPLDAPIPGFHTREGYQTYVRPTIDATAEDLLDESWILGRYAPTEIDAGRVRDAVRDRYMRDYARVYEDLLADIRIRPFSTVNEAAEILDVLSLEERSPLVSLLRAVSEQTELQPRPAGDAESGGAASANLGGLFSRDDEAPVVTRSVVDERFEWLHEFVGGTGTEAGPIARVLEQLVELSYVMSRVADESASGGVSDASARDAESAIRDLQAEARQQPEVVRALLDEAATRTRSIAFGGVMVTLNRAWQPHVDFCRRAIGGRYPIDRDNEQEIALNDFAEFFRPGGRMDAFFRESLVEYVDTSTRPWRARSSTAVPIRLSAATIAQFERGRQISETFFGSSATPSVSFFLTPYDMDTSVNTFSLTLEGKRIEYSHDVQLRQSMLWPGPEAGSGVVIQMVPEGGIRRIEGSWAWFRLLDTANVRPGDRAERFQVDFTIGNRWAQYMLDAGSALNPFDFDALTQFSCPESL